MLPNVMSNLLRCMTNFYIQGKLLFGLNRLTDYSNSHNLLFFCSVFGKFKVSGRPTGVT